MGTPVKHRVVVTGANSGIGKVMATELARLDREVILICRNEQRGEAALADIKKQTGNDDVTLMLADMGEMASVREVGKKLADKYDRIDTLINNAGLYMPDRQETSEGNEMMMAVNHLGPFLLTHMLAEPLKAAHAHVIGVASIGHHFGRMDVKDLNATKGFRAMPQYGITKLANILFTRMLAERWKAFDVRANCFHPGPVATGFAQDAPSALGKAMGFIRFALRTAAEGADTGVFLATTHVPETGEYWSDRRIKRGSAQSRDMKLAEALWAESKRLTDAPGA